MESNWRWNCVLGGNFTWGHNPDGTYITQGKFLAELDPWVTVGPVTYRYLFEEVTTFGLRIVWLLPFMGYAYDPDQLVMLNPATHFPHGFSVLPD